MKKKIVLLVTATLISLTTALNAQDEQCFKKGTSALNLGIGVGNTLSYDNGYAYAGVYGVGHAVFTPAFTASYEYGIVHVGIGIIGAGLEFGFQGTHYDYPNSAYREKWTTLAFSPRATYHFDFLNKKKFDIYGIVQLNIYANSYSDNYNPNGTITTYSSNSVGVRPGIMVAARYFFTPNFGVYSELGYDISIIKAGLSFKFGGK
jgi:hypothetical protein